MRTISTIAPIVTHESATLNTGHQPTATKSTTCPRRNPGDAEDPVDEVAERAAEHQREPDERSSGRSSWRTRRGEHDRDHDRDDREDRRDALEAG